MATVVSLVTLVIVSMGMFSELQDALNFIWRITPKKNAALWGAIKSRFLPFMLVIGTGFLLLVSLISLQAFRKAYGYLRRLPCHASRFSLDNHSRSDCIAIGPASTDPVRTDRPARLNPHTPAECSAVDGSYCLPRN